MSMSKDTLALIAEEIRSCTLCALHQTRTQAVPGQGESHAQIMFIGEAPGFHEDQQGIPFVGTSGRYLDELLRMIQLHRDDIFITNVVRCRPPRNRDPFRSEIAACQTYTERQIALINPRMIVTLGRFSMALFFGETAKISAIHGQPKVENGRIYYPLYHPAAVLRNPLLRATMEADFWRMREIIDNVERYLSGDNNDSTSPQHPQQLSLF
ncbi:MAG: uracil-DNA glycosylase [Phototrophicales bacterium]|nr:MAG: uracil-DNA glycosylase [Phototrophicales bacterium]